MKELIAYETWHGVMWQRWRRLRWGLARWTGCKCEGQVGGFEVRDHVWWWCLGKTWRRWTEATVKSKWGQDRWTNTVMWWYKVDNIIWWLVGACVASTSEELEWNAQGKGITIWLFHFTSHRCVEKLMTEFRIDGRTIKRGKLVCISVI
jgi:hypothetical protein